MGNREDLVAGARRCLAEKGYAASTVRDIAAAAGVSMAAIGYHFGSREALLNHALFELVGEWGAAVTAAGEATGGNYASWWQRLIDSFTADRTLFLASVEAALLGEHSTALGAQLADGLGQGRRGMAATVLGVAEDDLDAETVRTVGGVQLALVTGVLLQWQGDPEGAPNGADVAAGLRALADHVDGGSGQDAGHAGRAT